MGEDTEKTGQERRKFPRKPLSLLVQFRFNTFENFLAEYSDNISLGGIFIRTETPKEKGSIIYLQFSLEDGEQLIEGVGPVVHVNEPGVAGRVPGMGVEFMNFDDASMRLIEEICQSRPSSH